jgi:hypothetical protein
MDEGRAEDRAVGVPLRIGTDEVVVAEEPDLPLVQRQGGPGLEAVRDDAVGLDPVESDPEDAVPRRSCGLR